MSSQLHLRSCIAAAILILAAAALFTPSTVRAQNASPADPFIGRWKFDAGLSRLHSGERYQAYTRSYTPDGEKVRVAWVIDRGNGKIDKDSYAARCDGKEEPANGGNRIRCWKIDRNTIDGDVFSTDPVHRYYRRQVSPDGARLSLIWYSDSKRQTQSEVIVFVRVP